MPGGFSCNVGRGSHFPGSFTSSRISSPPHASPRSPFPVSRSAIRRGRSAPPQWEVWDSSSHPPGTSETFCVVWAGPEHHLWRTAEKFHAQKHETCFMPRWWNISQVIHKPHLFKKTKQRKMRQTQKIPAKSPEEKLLEKISSPLLSRLSKYDKTEDAPEDGKGLNVVLTFNKAVVMKQVMHRLINVPWVPGKITRKLIWKSIRIKR